MYNKMLNEELLFKWESIKQLLEKKDSSIVNPDVQEYYPKRDSSSTIVIENNLDAIILVDAKTNTIVYVNEAAIAIFNRKKEKIILSNANSLMRNFKSVVIKKIKEKAFDQEDSVDLIQPGGKAINCSMKLFPYSDELLGIVAKDISVIQQVSHELSVSSEVYKRLIDNLPGFVYKCKNDKDWSMLFMSDQVHEITGYAANEIVKNNIISYAELIREDYRAEVWESVQEAVDQKKRFNITYPIIHKNSKQVWLSERGVGVYDSKGELTHIEGFVVNHTETIRNEQIQQLVFNISTAVSSAENLESLIKLIKDQLGEIIDTTNFYIALYDSQSDTFTLPFFKDEKDAVNSIPAGKTMTKYVVETKKSLLANIKKKKELVKLGKLEYKGTLSKVWLGVPLFLEGNIIGVLAVQSYEDENAFTENDMKMLEFVSDQISLSIHRKKSEDELKEALFKAEQADRLKSSFLANMSHEIRTPMNGILGFTELLKDDDITKEEKLQFLKIIDKSGHRMLNIINDLIDVSKVDAGLMEVHISGVDVYEVTSYLYSFFLPEVEAKKMKLILNHGTKSGSFFMETDGEKLYAILTNLIKNAIKYSNEGEVNFGYTDKGKNIEFYVKDTGIGIPDEKKKDVFNRFVQLNSTTDPFTEGSGLGLTITKAYTELLGGKIWFESEVNKGSSFYFRIPINSLAKKII